ncbi:uncharacterized protein LOC129597470 [Paramacrobiotus metropolitanus]|uniref:uncharacterized protein LOC129597470 n=1 Tax=Paramacrobiotus metropolitanus TaxID=2943436 RepID=UPI002445EA2D|nr:uncharacterized protein LOC129597470 [Paramacrobiotus metropolitanus]XP_055351010.1 uncharacterized protein LOC129597470 [Paramacrobiotus metropolitanus]XP_055351011.1 uncharacterized protein LOC129597470 [Paramacrobiotus metropolitanus]
MGDVLRSQPSLDIKLKSTELQYLEFKRFDITVNEDETKENAPNYGDQSVILVEEPEEEQKKSITLRDKLTHSEETANHIPMSASIVSAFEGNKCQTELIKQKYKLAEKLAEISPDTKNVMRHLHPKCPEKIEELIIFTEYEGDLLPLSALITTRQFRVSLVPQFTCQILAGLSVLHKHGIIHKDIRCSNILVQKPVKEATYTLKIAHFEKASFDSNKSSLGEHDICPEGSSQFSSPEMQELTFDIKDQCNRIGTATDVYSLGCTVIEMVQRSPPRWIYYKDGRMMQYNFKPERTLTEFVINLHTLSINQAEPDTSALGSQGDAVKFVKACIARFPDERSTCEELQKHAFITKPEM